MFSIGSQWYCQLPFSYHNNINLLYSSRQLSGANIKIAGVEEGCPDRLVTITGVPESIAIAQHLINARLVEWSYKGYVWTPPSGQITWHGLKFWTRAITDISWRGWNGKSTTVICSQKCSPYAAGSHFFRNFLISCVSVLFRNCFKFQFREISLSSVNSRWSLLDILSRSQSHHCTSATMINDLAIVILLLRDVTVIFNIFTDFFSAP